MARPHPAQPQVPLALGSLVRGVSECLLLSTGASAPQGSCTGQAGGNHVKHSPNPKPTHAQGAGHHGMQQQQAVQRARAQLPGEQTVLLLQGLRHHQAAVCGSRGSRDGAQHPSLVRKTVSFLEV